MMVYSVFDNVNYYFGCVVRVFELDEYDIKLLIMLYCELWVECNVCMDDGLVGIFIGF